MPESIVLKEEFDVAPNILFNAWLDSKQHSEMTGGQAECGNMVGESFTAWDGYISGKNIALSLNKEIIQTWRTTEFADSDEDSKLVIQLSATENGTELTLLHTNIPDGQTQYEQGWIDHYFNPMKAYFASR